MANTASANGNRGGRTEREERKFKKWRGAKGKLNNNNFSKDKRHGKK
jgi:hypothetical protein